MSKKILFVNQEMTPYVPETEMSVLGRAVPEQMQADGYDIRTFMPKWGFINERRGQLHEVIRLSGLNVIINNTDHPLLIKVASIPQIRLQVYFIDNEDYFSQHQMAEDSSGDDCPDNGERAVFFARGVLETVKKLRWTPDIVHCQGWMSSIVPLYIKTAYAEEPSFANTKVITALSQSKPKADLGDELKKFVSFKTASEDKLAAYKDKFDALELGKLAVDFSDGVIEADEKVNKNLLKYAQKQNIPLLEYPGEDFAKAYQKFYLELTK